MLTEFLFLFHSNFENSKRGFLANSERSPVTASDFAFGQSANSKSDIVGRQSREIDPSTNFEPSLCPAAGNQDPISRRMMKINSNSDISTEELRESIFFKNIVFDSECLGCIVGCLCK